MYVLLYVCAAVRVFTTISAALGSATDPEWNTLATATKQLPPALQSALKDPKTEVTLFAPSNAAFKAVPGALSLPQSTLTSILSYHAAPGYREAPEGFRSGEKMSTLLKGHFLNARVS
jgi:uncharacterized surface protein with fasciclin (FAS1) repeats